MGIKETPNGGNLTFDCSPSGPCIPCSRSEKNDEKYRCSETGYRIRLKCQPTGSSSEKEKSQKLEKGRSDLETEQSTISTGQRSLLDDSSKSKGGSNSYITYRSCIPAVYEEKLSVFDFEGIMIVLLISSGSFIYFRRKRSSKIPTNSWF
ncbi:Structural poly [Olea europaea subsp. europaea]|nr:Structural poly [Olea europaea subsp. europaea]